MNSNKKKLHLPKLCLIASVCCLCLCFWTIIRETQKYLSVSREKCLISDEILSVESNFRFLTPDFSDSLLAYIRAVESGRSLFIVNVSNLSIVKIPCTNEVLQIYNWSRDSRYLAYSEITHHFFPYGGDANGNKNETLLSIYDKCSNTTTRLTEASNVLEGSFAWLSSNYFTFSSRSLLNNEVIKFIGKWPGRAMSQVNHQVSDFVLISNDYAAFFFNGNIATTSLSESQYVKPVVVCDLEPYSLKMLNWLRYCADDNRYMFCAKADADDFSCLFAFDPVRLTLQRLTSEYTYNGQWLHNGAGFAYVANKSNHFSLVLRPSNTNENTNLFSNGSLANYVVSSSGEKLYATASVGMEPQSIWQYNVRTHELRSIVNGVDKPFSKSCISVPQESNAVAKDGLLVPYFVFSPTRLPASSAGEKFPAIFYLPPPTSQMQRGYQAISQLYANLGYYFICVNFRGCDGYGYRYSSYRDDEKATRDVISVFEDVLKMHNIDTNNVCLYAMSGGGEVMGKLLMMHPKYWKTAVFDHPAISLDYTQLNRDTLPSIFISTGDQDPGYDWVKRFQLWALNNCLEHEILVFTNCAHVNWKGAELKNQQLQTVTFLEHRL